jgi:hypothetical protein
MRWNGISIMRFSLRKWMMGVGFGLKNMNAAASHSQTTDGNGFAVR